MPFLRSKLQNGHVEKKVFKVFLSWCVENNLYGLVIVHLRMGIDFQTTFSRSTQNSELILLETE